jgi:hypothetical protein
MADITFLGPQRLAPTAAEAVDVIAPEGTAAIITSGWQEAESEEADEIIQSLNRPTIKVLLHQRSDDIFQRDPEFFEAYRGRQNQLHQLREFYRLRLGHALEAARDLMQRDGSEHIIEPEREAAFDAVRTLDEHHFQRLREVHRSFEEQWRPKEREVIARHRDEVAEQLEEASVLVVAGGHVAVLLYRMTLLNMAPLIEKLPIVAWSAGAMALSERVVLFHDSPPQGEGNPELLESGLALVRQVLPFPHARRRLKLKDPIRVSLLARRFAPKLCVAMERGSKLERRDGQWTAGAGTLRFADTGQLVEFSS